MVLAISKTDKDDAVDYKGNPVDNSKTGGWLAAGLILGTELSERICVMGISMNLVTYLVGELHLSSSKSANTVTNFMGALNILALFGGFLADAKLGRYLTIAIFASICAVGVTLLTLATTLTSMKPPHCDNPRKQQCIEASGSQLTLLYVALYTIALGGGGIKSNVSGFGSDQFDTSDPKEEKAMVYFFNRFYFCISLGSLFAVTVLVYIQDNVGRGWGYGISAGTMIIAVIVLLCGTTLYRFKQPQGSPLTVIWRVVFLAIKNRSLPYPANPGFLNGFSDSKVPHTTKFRPADSDNPPYVARVAKLEADHRNNVKVKVRWYYRPEESLGGRRPFHGVKELFLSDHYDYQSAHTIQGKCVVHSFKNYTKLESVGTEDYFCRFEYKAATGGFTPDRVAVYCKCEMPYNPDDLMVQCEECKDWFHPACMGMTIEDAKKLEQFLCSDCASDDDAKGQLNSFPISSSTEVKVESKRRKR